MEASDETKELCKAGNAGGWRCRRARRRCWIALLAKQRDPWRDDHPFSNDMAERHRILFDPASSRDEMAEALAAWLGDRQPCLFG